MVRFGLTRHAEGRRIASNQRCLIAPLVVAFLITPVQGRELTIKTQPSLWACKDPHLALEHENLMQLRRFDAASKLQKDTAARRRCRTFRTGAQVYV
jgi:hypothetical protein